MLESNKHLDAVSINFGKFSIDTISINQVKVYFNMHESSFVDVTNLAEVLT